MFSEPLSQYEEILKDAIRTSMKESGAKLAKTFQTLLIEILTLYGWFYKLALLDFELIFEVKMQESEGV
ncbi:hypothetical protein ABVC73_13235 [Prevotella melaninogenica]